MLNTERVQSIGELLVVVFRHSETILGAVAARFSACNHLLILGEFFAGRRALVATFCATLEHVFGKWTVPRT